MPDPRDGIVYTETIIHAAPEQYTADAPYQLAVLDLDAGGRLTARILGKTPEERVRIGDRVTFVEELNGVVYYKRIEIQGVA